MEMDNLISAVDDALDVENSDRTTLLNIYTNSWKDSQVISEREKAEAFIISESFEVLENENMSEEKTKLFQRPWYEKFVTLALYIEFWGHTLAEFQEQDENGEFVDVKVFPRRHVRPFEKLLVIQPGDREGISYDGHETEYFLLELGDPENLGKLETISKEVIWKTFARSDWSEFNERFGKPFLEIATDAESDAELDEKDAMMANSGANLRMTHNKGDEFTVHQIGASDPGNNFRSKAEFCDDQIAKLMNGQTGTGDQKSFVGAAEVHERILSKFNKARLLRIQHIVNYKLIPFLIAHGYPLENCRIEYLRLRDNEDGAQDPGDPDPDDGPRHGFFGKKKALTLPSWVLSM